MSYQTDVANNMIRICLVGETGVGKSSIFIRYVDDKYNNNTINTLGVDIKHKTLIVDDVYYRLRITDTAGLERFRSITENYFRGQQGFLLVYDVTNRSSLNMVQGWVREIHEHADDKAVIVLIGNKSDLVADSAREVTYNEGDDLAKTLGIQFFETSAAQNQKIDAAFECLVRSIIPTLSKRIVPDAIRLDRTRKRNDCCGVPSRHDLESPLLGREFGVMPDRDHLSTLVHIQNVQNQPEFKLLTMVLTQIQSSEQKIVNQLTSQHQEVNEKLDEQLKLAKEQNYQLMKQENMLRTLVEDIHSVPIHFVLLPALDKQSLTAQPLTALFSKSVILSFLQDTYYFCFICAHTYQLTLCGSSDEKCGYKITKPKEWVRRAAPYIQAGLAMAKIGLKLSGIPLPIPDFNDIIGTSSIHSQYLDCSMKYVNNIINETANTLQAAASDNTRQFQGSKVNMSYNKDIDTFESTEYINQLNITLESTSKQRTAFEAVRSFLREHDPLMQFMGLRKVTNVNGTTAWIFDNNAVEHSFQNGSSSDDLYTNACQAIQLVRKNHSEMLQKKKRKLFCGVNSCCKK